MRHLLYMQVQLMLYRNQQLVFIFICVNALKYIPKNVGFFCCFLNFCRLQDGVSLSPEHISHIIPASAFHNESDE